MIDLNPCPCCGHRAELCKESTDYGDWYTIECVGCGLMIEGSDRQKVIDAWQRRRTDGMIAWLDAEIEKCERSNKDALIQVAGVGATVAFKRCKKQLLKLLDGMGVE